MEDPEVRTFYVRYMHLCADLYWSNAGRKDECGMDGNDPYGLMHDELTATPQPAAPSSIHPASFILHHLPMFSSYAIASLILGVGIVAAWAWRTSSDLRPGGGNPAPAFTAPTMPVKHTRIGRITATVGCRWAHPDSLPEGPLGGALGTDGRPFGNRPRRRRQR